MVFNKLNYGVMKLKWKNMLILTSFKPIWESNQFARLKSRKEIDFQNGLWNVAFGPL
jgi:hypothetical protein